MDYLKEIIEKWLIENSHKSLLLGNNILTMQPQVGLFIKVNDIEIPQIVFKKEYDVIVTAYFSVMKKLDEHYKRMRKND